MSACAGRCLAARLTQYPKHTVVQIATRGVGHDSRHGSLTFKPRASSCRLCKQKVIRFRCHASASSAGQPPHTEPAQTLSRIAAAVLAVWQQSMNQLAEFIHWKGGQQDTTAEEKYEQIRQTIKNMHCLCAVAPFAAAQTVNTPLLLAKSILNFMKVYLMLLYIRVLFSWFSAFNWDRQPWLAVRQVTDPYLNLFRGVIPPLLGSIDFTPLFGFYLLQALTTFFVIPDWSLPHPSMLQEALDDPSFPHKTRLVGTR